MGLNEFMSDNFIKNMFRSMKKNPIKMMTTYCNETLKGSHFQTELKAQLPGRMW